MRSLNCIILGTEITPNGSIEAETNKSSASDENETPVISISAAGAIPPGNHDKMTKNVVQV
jgi:hypothetical protein